MSEISPSAAPMADSAMDSVSQTFQWRFFRIGGLDQVTLRTAEELRHLAELDPKLWVALSCPVSGLEFDSRTLALIDGNQDGRIRIPEVLDAVQWTVDRLQDPAAMVEGRAALPLERIRKDTDEGSQLLASASRILRAQGKNGAAELTQDDVTSAVTAASAMLLNGDGIIPASPELEGDLLGFVQDVMAVEGSVPDASGQPGVSQALAQGFLDHARIWRGWQAELAACAAQLPLGAATDAAYALVRELAPKIDDYFVRCRLVTFDPRASDAVNASETVLTQLGEASLNGEESAMVELPLARVEAGSPLPLSDGLNPAWQGRVHTLRDSVIVPLLGQRESLSEEDWHETRQSFASYAAVVEAKPAVPDAMASLNGERLDVLLGGDISARFEALAAQDLAAAEEVVHIGDVERLTLYHAHLHSLLMNFVSFCDFYAPNTATTFQVGRLYIDGRGCDLCLRVDNVDAHAARSGLSYLCLAYCACTRTGGTETMNIVAAVTAGNSEWLVPGRHGVFVDRAGQTWDATLLKLIDNPISIRTAMFAPYLRMGRMVTTQIEKMTAAKDASLTADSGKAVDKLLTVPGGVSSGASGADVAKAPPFDIGKSMGIFAAIGLALGALGTAAASIAASVMSLAWWQFPLLILGIFLCISGPSMLLAWLKLRKRTLGPVLDASGWAVNTLIPINLVMGHFLTDSAELPPNIRRSLNDPFQKPRFWKGWMTAVLALCFLAGCAFGGWWAWDRYHQEKPVSVVTEPAQAGGSSAEDAANKKAATEKAGVAEGKSGS